MRFRYHVGLLLGEPVEHRRLVLQADATGDDVGKLAAELTAETFDGDVLGDAAPSVGSGIVP